MVLKDDICASSSEGHLDTVTMLKYAETNKRGSAMEIAFLEVRKSFSFNSVYHESANRLNVILAPFLDVLLVMIWLIKHVKG